MEKISLLIKKVNLEHLQLILLSLFLFLLPWQTRWIFRSGFLNDGFWEYGTKSLYGTEILLWLIFLVFIVDRYFYFKRSRNGIGESCEVNGQKKLKGFLHLPLRLGRNDKLIMSFGLVLIVILGLSIFYGSNQTLSWYFCLRLGEGMALCFILSRLKYSNTKLLVALWIGGAVQGILAGIQFFTQEISANKWLGLAGHHAGQLGAGVIETNSGRWLRAYGSFGWPNSLGIYLAVVWIVGFILYLSIQNKNYRAIIFGGQLIILSGLILSFSRGAWVAAGVGLGILFFYNVIKRSALVEAKGTSPLRQKDHRSSLKIPLSASLLAIVFFLIILWPLFTTRLSTTTRLEERSVNERIGQYTQAKNIVMNNIWFGVGPGVYTFYLYKLNPTLEVWDYQPIHNIYALMLAEIGTLFSCFHVFMFSCFLYFVWKRNPLFISVAAVLLVAGIFDHWLWSMYTGQMLWFVVWGLSLSFYSNKK